MKANVPLWPGFRQVCIWENITVGNDRERIEAFVEFVMAKFLGTRIQYLEEVRTNPSTSRSGKVLIGTGNRNDLLFAVHEDDLHVFDERRLNFGIRWIEDVFGHGGAPLYEARIADYQSWDSWPGSAHRIVVTE